LISTHQPHRSYSCFSEFLRFSIRRPSQIAEDFAYINPKETKLARPQVINTLKPAFAIRKTGGTSWQLHQLEIRNFLQEELQGLSE
jgi:hypothetical protein